MAGMILGEVKFMRVYGNQKPPTFTIDPQPGRPNHVWLRFYENAVQDDEGWSWDEYGLVVLNNPGLRQSIEDNFDDWVLTVKSLASDAANVATHNGEASESARTGGQS